MVKHVYKVHLSQSISCPQFTLSPTETPASNSGVFTKILPHFVFEILSDLGSVSSWTRLAKIFHLSTHLVLKFIGPMHLK